MLLGRTPYIGYFGVESAHDRGMVASVLERLDLRDTKVDDAALAKLAADVRAIYGVAVQFVAKEPLPELRVLWLARGPGPASLGGDPLIVPCSFEALALRVRQALDARPGLGGVGFGGPAHAATQTFAGGRQFHVRSRTARRDDSLDGAAMVALAQG